MKKYCFLNVNPSDCVKISHAFSIHLSPNSFKTIFGKSVLQVPDTGTRVLDNTRPFLHSSIVSFWITLARSIERKYHIFRQYWYTRNVPVFNNTGTFQYLGPEVYFFPIFLSGWKYVSKLCIFSSFKKAFFGKNHVVFFRKFYSQHILISLHDPSNER